MDESKEKFFTSLTSLSSVQNPDSNKQPTYSRKEKSLGVLCTNFLNLYDQHDVESIVLDDAIKRLGVERRRIYDIVNVLDGIGVLSKKGKNEYYWKGLGGIPEVLNELKEEALKGNSLCIFSNSNSAKVPDDDEEEKSLDQSIGKSQETSNPDQTFHELVAASTLAKVEKRDKSLKLLTQNFVKLLLFSNTKLVTLDEAAQILLGDTNNSSEKQRTHAAKIRRLYDIANVLSSMSLIQKTQDFEKKKPVFKWLGFSESLHIRSPNSKKRAFGTEITTTDFKRNKVDFTINQNLISKTQMRSKCKGLKEGEFDGTQVQQKQKEPKKRSNKDVAFGPFSFVSSPNVGDTVKKKPGLSVQEVEKLASSYRSSYHNQALHDLFSHFVEARNAWYSRIAKQDPPVQKSKSS